MSKQILGIYLDKTTLQYACAEKKIVSWHLQKPAQELEPFGELPDGDGPGLRDFLKKIPVQKKRQLIILLPGNLFVAREIQLPAMALEEALTAVKNMLELVCHLPVAEIFHDILLCRLPDKRINALIIYAPKRDISPVLDIVRETGHERSLKAVAPVALGLSVWLNLQKQPMPMGLVTSGDEMDISIFTTNGCLYSASVSLPHPGGGNSIAAISSRMKLSVDRFFSLHPGTGLQTLVVQPCHGLKLFQDIPGPFMAAALAYGFNPGQNISISGSPTRLRIFPWWKTWLIIAVLTSLWPVFWTWNTTRRIDANTAEIAQLKTRNRQLSDVIRPLEKNRDADQGKKLLIDELNTFMNTRPKVFAWLNGIADKVPEGTWFSRCTLTGQDLVVQGQSKDAIRVLEALRGLDVVEQVKLMGTVTKGPDGMELFTMNIRMHETVPPAADNPKPAEKE
ncbi:MAG: PilN domain-containing protein [Desulfatirhabdiaceae bacterium]